MSSLYAALSTIFNRLRCNFRWNDQDGELDRVRHLAYIRMQLPPKQFARFLADEVDRSLVSALDEVAGNAVAQFFRGAGCAHDHDAERLKEGNQGIFHGDNP
jgi:hypothetical protein